MEELDIENALELYESLPVSSKASDLYFDKIILNESGEEGFKKILSFFKKKNDATTMVNTMITSLDGMINCINMSPYATDEVKQNDIKALTFYKTNISALASKLAAANSKMDALQHKIEKGSVGEELKTDTKEKDKEDTESVKSLEDTESVESTEDTE